MPMVLPSLLFHGGKIFPYPTISSISMVSVTYRRAETAILEDVICLVILQAFLK